MKRLRGEMGLTQETRAEKQEGGPPAQRPGFSRPHFASTDAHVTEAFSNRSFHTQGHHHAQLNKNTGKNHL